MSREEILAGALPARRHAAALREHARFEGFCQHLAIDADIDAVSIYLTALLQDGLTHGRGLRYRLGLLDGAARLAGHPPPSHHPDLRRYLRGLHRQAALRTPETVLDPLQREWLYALGDAVIRPLPSQRRDVALLLTARATHMPTSVLVALTWHDLRFRRDTAELRLPPFARRGARAKPVLTLQPRGDTTCPVRALKAWHVVRGPAGDGPLFGVNDALPDLGRIVRPVLHLLRRADGRPATEPQIKRRVAALLEPLPLARRDHALLLVGFSAALGTGEATRLTQADIRHDGAGLSVTVAGRRDPLVPIPPGNTAEHCPAHAWRSWRMQLRAQGRSGPRAPAFPQIAGTVIRQTPIREQGLNSVVNQRCQQAGLTGSYGWTSLRSGLVRSAVRAHVPEHDIARHAGLSALQSVRRHTERERLLSRNVADQVGL